MAERAFGPEKPFWISESLVHRPTAIDLDVLIAFLSSKLTVGLPNRYNIIKLL